MEGDGGEQRRELSNQHLPTLPNERLSTRLLWQLARCLFSFFLGAIIVVPTAFGLYSRVGDFGLGQALSGPQLIVLGIVASAVVGLGLNLAIVRKQRKVRGLARLRGSWVKNHAGWLGGLLPAIMFGGMGIHSWAVGTFAGDRLSVDVSALERGAEPGGRYVQVTGRLLRDQAVNVRGRDGHIRHVYTPVVSPEWRPGQPVRLYLKVTPFVLEKYAADLATQRYSGMLSRASIPGRTVDAPCWELDYLTTPTEMKGQAPFFIGGGVFSWLLAGVLWEIFEGRKRRARRADGTIS